MKKTFFLLPPSTNGELYPRIQNFLKVLRKLHIKTAIFYKKWGWSKFYLLLSFPGGILSSFDYPTIFLFVSRISFILVPFYKLILRKIVILDHFATSETGLGKNFPNILLRLERYGYKIADAVLTHSLTMKDVLSDYYKISPDKIFVINGIVDTDLFFKKGDSFKLKEKYHLIGKTVFIYHGLFHKWHGINYFLKAFKKLTIAYPNLISIFIGATKEDSIFYFPEFKEIPDANIIYLPRISNKDLPSFLSLGDFWIGRFRQDIIGKRSASFCMFEAMSMGLIPITSHSPENDRVIKDKVNGFLTKEMDAKDIERVVNNIIKNSDLKPISKNARMTIINKYSLKTIEDVFRKFL